MRKRKWLYGALVLMGVLNGCGRKTQTSNKLHIVASLNFYGETAKAVAGKYGTVTSIIKSPNVDPHDFEPTTNSAKAVAKADVVVYNGLGYDSWMQRLISSDSEGNVKALNVGKSVMNKQTGDNPHLWYNDQTMAKLANRLAKIYAKKDPKHRKQFEANAKNYVASLKVIQKKVAALKQNRQKSLVDVSEPVFNYALTKMGYKINNSHFALAVENGSDPSAQDIRQMQKDIKQHKIAFFVNNPQASDAIVKNMVTLAKKHNVPVLNVTETQPSNKTYIEWMTDQYQQVAEIQKKERLQ
ncbi:metal ABC transporter solute-binding protein, Zn/Mn family [Pediococcus inopinatus]|uniref:metal ABC transporter solute-binding protein, Zn/Mn family n=1 Tax=Pediococcus inopinatus TaxID=114090 RepID=UPI000710FC14|nr:zinc ABC transporter substrate-binding protein [Pediococcus inopinatus]AVK99261.1 metal ABC transporter substrate-binding protein [Pediococcus inopinatus]